MANEAAVRNGKHVGFKSRSDAGFYNAYEHDYAVLIFKSIYLFPLSLNIKIEVG